MARPCLVCGNDMPDEDVMCSLSHTIIRGERICSACGRRETLDQAWAEGRRIGLLRANACKQEPETAQENTNGSDTQEA